MTYKLMFFVWNLAALFLISGCVEAPPENDLNTVWGRRGLDDGRFQKPRAIAIDSKQYLFIVDMTGRIQVFDQNFRFVRSWRTPEIKMGKPCGLTVADDDTLMVADTHYHRILFYRNTGELIRDRTIGGQQGLNPGEFGYVTDVVQDSQGNYYVSEYGDFDRIQKFSPQGEFLLQWGGRGEEDGQFLRPQGLAIDDRDWLWVADSSNHRIQVFDVSGDSVQHVMTWGKHGWQAGEIRFPYDIVLAGEYVYVCELGNHRIQRFSRGGEPKGMWGEPGRGPGQLHQPWGMVIDAHNRLHVLDSYNHRVQTVNCDRWHWPARTRTVQPTDGE